MLLGGVWRAGPTVSDRRHVAVAGRDVVEQSGERRFARPVNRMVCPEGAQHLAGHGGDAAAADEHRDTGRANNSRKGPDLVEEKLVCVIQDRINVADREANGPGPCLVQGARERRLGIGREAQVEQLRLVAGLPERGHQVLEPHRRHRRLDIAVRVNEQDAHRRLLARCHMKTGASGGAPAECSPAAV